MNAPARSTSTTHVRHLSRVVLLWVLVGCLSLAGGFKLLEQLPRSQVDDRFIESNVAAALAYGGTFVALSILISGADSDRPNLP